MYKMCAVLHVSMHIGLYNIFVLQIRLTIGLYSIYFLDWLAAFPRHHFHILTTDEYKADTVEELNGILQFLDLSMK